MKKLKVLFAAIICAVCLCFALAGCSDGSYVKESFICEISEVDSSKDEIETSFAVKIKDDKDYKADYVITVKSKNGKITRKYGYTSNLKEPLNGKVIVTDWLYINRSDYGEDGYIVELTSLRIYPNNSEDKSVGYAIGFGVVGGVFLCGVTAFFLVDKLVFSKKEDK